MLLNKLKYIILKQSFVYLQFVFDYFKKILVNFISD